VDDKGGALYLTGDVSIVHTVFSFNTGIGAAFYAEKKAFVNVSSTVIQNNCPNYPFICDRGGGK